ncbi:MAG: 50S ribosomal protein L23 [Candidatus Nealsonbacteria bacterium CG_4_9_14_3_um_filter_37_13]|uniref:Large ribosomal subunit protein uL23 n=1 Tax=Candidatus Nealsonbacteria bacterium CG_4_9_14_3_um_filter_37_13 TaxID=1974695 RepID=A0A2M7Z5G6_9BACT|nr:MAG: 50S ribosomal protein L23 [Candidatus Nealsonbacteria bacterium CG_4_9_14_3_um_filter_37_13]
MILRDIFKKKKKEEPAEVKEEKPVGEVTRVKPRPSNPIKETKVGESWRVLKTPQVTEKATLLAKGNQYVFKVWSTAGKVEIKKAIENLYGVDVLSVKIIRVPAKRRRLGRIRGWRKGYKKAIVKIKEGQKIEIMPR